MLNLSIVSLNTDHIDEVCESIIQQHKDGVLTHAMFIMYFSPEGNPPINRAEQFCAKYDLFRERLDKAGVKHGVLLQSTIGHIYTPNIPHKFQTVVNFTNGNPQPSACCPLDEDFKQHMKSQLKILASHNPSIILLDDDVGLLYRYKGCACPLHLAEFNKRAGTNFTREELFACTQGNSEQDKKYTQIYVDLMRDSLLNFVKTLREGIDEVNPSILGAVSGITGSGYVEFTGDLAQAFAGKGNPSISRINGGIYTQKSPKNLSLKCYRAQMFLEGTKGKIDYYLAETDTCPQNRYATSASLLHAHFSNIIWQGAKGAKHWITRLAAYEPDSGMAYRKILAKHSKYYEELSKISDNLVPFGCRTPVSTYQNYDFIPSAYGINLVPWAANILEVFGLPMYFGNKGQGAVFLDSANAKRFTDEQIKDFFKGTVFLSRQTTMDLNARGFSDMTGVGFMDSWNGAHPSAEVVCGQRQSVQPSHKPIIIKKDGVKELSYVANKPGANTDVYLYPAVTSYKNPLGGTTIVFGGTINVDFKYFSGIFSFLNESRKKQFVEILLTSGNLPIYYPGDAEVFLEGGYIGSEIVCKFLNVGLDVLDEITLVCQNKVNKIQMLTSDGNKKELAFTAEGNTIKIDKSCGVLEPVILFIS